MSTRQVILELRADPRIARIQPEQRLQELQRLARERGLNLSLEQLGSELESLGDAELDQVAGGDGGYWGKMPNHSQGVSR